MSTSSFEISREFLDSHAVAHVLNSKPMWQPDVIALPETVPVEVALQCMNRSNIFRSPVLTGAASVVHARRETLHKSPPQQQSQQPREHKQPPAWARHFAGVISVADLLAAIVHHPVWSELRLDELAKGPWHQASPEMRSLAQEQHQAEPSAQQAQQPSNEVSSSVSTSMSKDASTSSTARIAHQWTAARTGATAHAVALHWTAPLRDALRQPLSAILPTDSLSSLVFADSHDALTSFCQVTDDSLNTVLVRDTLHLVDQRPPPPPMFFERHQPTMTDPATTAAGVGPVSEEASSPAVVWQPYFSAAGVSPHVFIMSNFDVLAYLCQHLDQLGALVHTSLLDLGVVQLPQAAAQSSLGTAPNESGDTSRSLFGPAEGVVLPSGVIAITSAYSALRGFCTLLELRKAHISALPIVNTDTRELVGTLSVNDARALSAERLHLLLKPVQTYLQSSSMAVVEGGAAPSAAAAERAAAALPAAATDSKSRMSWTFHETCTPTDRLSDVMLRMKSSHVHRVWVCDEHHHVIGVVSISDCLALLSGSAITQGARRLSAVSARSSAPAQSYSRMEM